MKDDLRSILRKGDPAAGEPGLTPEEVQGMRRAVLSAVPEPRRRGWMVPVLAGAAALILATMIAISLWVRPPLPLAGEGRGEGPAVMAEKPPPQPSPAPREREPEPPPAPKKRKKPVRRAPAPEPVVLAKAEIPPADHRPTQIQFSTPGGTRVIWVLRPATD